MHLPADSGQINGSDGVVSGGRTLLYGRLLLGNYRKRLVQRLHPLVAGELLHHLGQLRLRCLRWINHLVDVLCIRVVLSQCGHQGRWQAMVGGGKHKMGSEESISAMWRKQVQFVETEPHRRTSRGDAVGRAAAYLVGEEVQMTQPLLAQVVLWKHTADGLSQHLCKTEVGAECPRRRAVRRAPPGSRVREGCVRAVPFEAYRRLIPLVYSKGRALPHSTREARVMAVQLVTPFVTGEHHVL